MVAEALQADGWWLRSEIIWAKPNPMPESVRDRPTSSHEKIYLLTKSERYWYDAEAVREPSLWADDSRAGNGRFTYDGKRQGVPGTGQEAFVSINPAGRNLRNVWTFATEPFNGSRFLDGVGDGSGRIDHFATFPTELVRRCVLAGCPVGGTVLDPFGGSGTVGLVADRLQRNAILIEAKAEYVEMARRRVEGDAPLLQYSGLSPDCVPPTLLGGFV